MIVLHSSNSPSSTSLTGDYLTDLIANDSVTFLKQSKQYFLTDDYLTDLIANNSVTFLKQSKQYFPNR